MKRIINQLVLVGIVFLITQLFLIVVLDISSLSFYVPEVWSRWDSGHYLAIAKQGYEFFPCAGKFGYPIDATEMCGNTGWFPGYPLLIRVLSYIVTDETFLGVVISKTFYFLSLWMVLIISKIDKISFKNIIYLLLAAFSFGFIYYNAVFPISAVLFFSLLGFYFFLKRKLWLTGLCCFLAAFFYPTGFLLSFAIAVTLLFNDQKERRLNILGKCLIPLFCGGVGLLLVFFIFQLQVDDWSAFIQVQAKYGHGFHNPIKGIGDMLKGISSTIFALENTIILQSVLVIIGYLLLSVFFIIKKLYRNELYLLSFSYITLFLITPWIVGGSLSMYRAESLLFPFVFLLKDLSMPWKISLLAVLMSVGGIMSYLFFTFVLV